MAIDKVTVSLDLSIDTIKLLEKIGKNISAENHEETLQYALERMYQLQEGHQHERSTLVLAPHVDREKIKLMEEPELPRDAIIMKLPPGSYRQIQYMIDLTDKRQ